jgi:hypothetical protein
LSEVKNVRSFHRDRIHNGPSAISQGHQRTELYGVVGHSVANRKRPHRRSTQGHEVPADTKSQPNVSGECADVCPRRAFDQQLNINPSLCSAGGTSLKPTDGHRSRCQINIFSCPRQIVGAVTVNFDG